MGLLVTSIIGVRVIPDFVSLVVFIRFRKIHASSSHSQCASLAVIIMTEGLECSPQGYRLHCMLLLSARIIIIVFDKMKGFRYRRTLFYKWLPWVLLYFNDL